MKTPETTRQNHSAAVGRPLPRFPENALEVDGVSKHYSIVARSTNRLAAMLLWRLATKQYRRDLWAVSDLSFDVRRGEILGIIGPNGAGKSTLLRLIAGISYPDRGEIRSLPRVAALLDLSAGFHPALTGYENVFLTSSLLGIPRDEMRARLPEIGAFSGLDHETLETPLRYYSTGMIARLGLAVAIHTDPDIILIDEVLAVGDSEFQVRSAGALLKFAEQGRTLVLVSHLIDQVEYLCERTLWLDGGRCIHFGPTQEVTPQYRRWLNERIQRRQMLDVGGGHRVVRLRESSRNHAQAAEATARPANAILIEAVALRDGEGRATSSFPVGGTLELEARVKPAQPSPPVGDWDLLVQIINQAGDVIEEFTATEKGLALPEPAGAGRLRLRISPVYLYGGKFTLLLQARRRSEFEQELGPPVEIPFEITMNLDDIAPLVCGTLPFELEIQMD